jgi:hypothetical protein
LWVETDFGFFTPSYDDENEFSKVEFFFEEIIRIIDY